MEAKDIDRIIKMVREDRKPFEAIKVQFALTVSDEIAFMRRKLNRSSFNLWWQRMHNGISQKYAQLRSK